jgi:hypothetical protein
MSKRSGEDPELAPGGSGRGALVVVGRNARQALPGIGLWHLTGRMPVLWTTNEQTQATVMHADGE